MAELDDSFQAIPPETEPPEDPASELAAVDEEAQPFEAAGPSSPPPLGRTPAYDFVNHEIIPGAGGGPLMVSGLDGLAQWIDKALRTPRGAAPAVHPDFGIESVHHLVTGGPFDASAAAELEDMVREALTVHPRITAVEDWEAEYLEGDDAVFLRFRVIAEGDDELEEQELTIDTSIPIGEEQNLVAA